MIAIDTNLLVYAHRSAAPQHAAARRAIEKAVADGGCGICLPSIAEFWSIVTSPSMGKRPSTHEEASGFIRELMRTGGLEIWLPGRGFGERMMNHATAAGVSGDRIFDLVIALIAIENGAHEIWTHDLDFVHVPGLRVHDPIGRSQEWTREQ